MIEVVEVSKSLPSKFNNLKLTSEYAKIKKAAGTTKIYSDQQTSNDLAIKSVKKLKSEINNISLLIFVTQTPTYNIPTNACIIHQKFKINEKAMCFDINMGCSGFIYALKIVHDYFSTNESTKALIICSDTYTNHTLYKNSNTKNLFSNCSTAVLLKKNIRKKFYFQLGTQGSFHDFYCVQNKIYMNGSAIIKFTLKRIPELINETLKANNVKKEEIDYYLIHQASKLVLEGIINNLRLNKKKVPINISKYGNTVSSSIPLLIGDLIYKKKYTKGLKIIACGFGVGLSWGATFFKT